MIPALVEGRLARATPGARGVCPLCTQNVYARVPEHAIRHWAHFPLADGEERACDNHEPGEMTEWHLNWQHQRTDLECIEVVGPDRQHIADTINADGQVIEFQHSAIKPEKVASRERYWGRGAWVIDGTEAEIQLRRKPEQDPADPWRIFIWPRAHNLLYQAQWPCWIDLGGFMMIQVRTMHQDRKPRGGDGWLVGAPWFTDNVLNGKRVMFRRYQRPQPKQATSSRAGNTREETAADLYVRPEDCPREPIGNGLPQWAVRKHICTLCGNPGRLYNIGWRCQSHSPRAQRRSA